MIGGVVEIASEGQHISKYRGFLKATANGVEVGRVPFDEIDVLILSAKNITITRGAIAALSDRGIAVIFVNDKFLPECILTPVNGGDFTTGHPMDQAKATEAFNGRLWKRLVVQKITNQAAVISTISNANAGYTALRNMAARVKNGDPTNIEATAARTYFSILFGKQFKRERMSSDDMNSINQHLNYGYAILRAACARSICAVGLSPVFGIKHHSGRNRLCLADDLIEIFRPIVDLSVYELATANELPANLTSESKLAIAGVLAHTMYHKDTKTSCTAAIQNAALQIAKAYAHGTYELTLPRLRFAERADQ